MTTRSTTSPVLRAHVALLGVVIVWGTTFTLVKSALADCSPLLFNFLRMVLATVVLAALHRHSLADALRAQPRVVLRAGALAGVFLGLGYELQTVGLALTTPSKSGFITGLVVVFVPLLGLLPGVLAPGAARPGWPALAGALLAFTGLVLLTTSGRQSFSWLGVMGTGEWLTLGCAVAFAAHLLTLNRVAPRIDPGTLATLQIGFAALLMGVLLPAGAPLHLHMTARLAGTLVLTAVLATALAFTAQSWAQRHLSATNTALIFTLEPIFAWLTSLVVLHERLGGKELSGAALIVCGILISELMPARTEA
jgi:drug/metabolite transporter (DMT)-like permease